MKLLNLGCGSTYHKDWINLDIEAIPPRVQGWDLRKGIPFPPDHFDACYHSHVLEHLKPEEGKRFLEDCLRVLKPGGILRIAVPDMEGIAREYLLQLEKAKAGGSDEAYAWMQLELLDQLVRDKSEGNMGAFLRAANPESREFIVSRLGWEAKSIWNQADPAAPRSKRFNRGMGFYGRRLKALAAKTLIRIFFGKAYQTAFQEGLFRNQGEVHKWMYDAHSLARAVGSAGFAQAKVCRADESGIPGFAAFGLDMIDGKTRKPDSFFMECRKPG